MKPKDEQPAEDKHYYNYYIRPHYFQLGQQMTQDESHKTVPVEIIFDTDLTKHEWAFLRLVVEAVESELNGPTDISDMLAQELMATEELGEQQGTSPTPPAHSPTQPPPSPASKQRSSGRGQEAHLQRYAPMG
ncbi:hypothetical protein B0T14DRAFT_515471 [Immersiella caudata]|uniref:Uncharacterized protein n=1 Tax=Immersiella caudata TaxID=314043 RepID=A0AA39WWY7_9PEZI|nr:hypothetical protein B0T14DRAFT_515471 [Immersiella caudata]